ncbi:UDP-N-acetylglucosamine--N-acetylmuramyl-(pentapeptide) pyrophosphoryl-undecaprenol N-acetylglucosamine transferase [Candidatus Dojkabacteria bacterium]|nr:UDP-N-acetylglucosamine--N-acetylmuramyl-(pentapeptide) pyrophosphoryl-undecaprenol N-acetylglucosamine transferase [Candidatus Dojkabacteria bacterium]
MKKNNKIVFTGGGSGGHTLAAMLVLEELLRRNPGIKERIIYVGGDLAMEGEVAQRSFEEKEAERRNISFFRIRAGKLQRNFSLQTIKLLFGVIGGIIDSWRFFNENEVDLLFSTGGYVTVPVCFVAWLKKIPIIIHEQTTNVGLANKLCAMFSKIVLIGHKESARHFRRKKTVFVGNPIRCSFKSLKCCPNEHKSRVKLFKERSSRYPIIIVYGGGLGSHLINETVRQALKFLISNYQLIIITGDNKVFKDYDRFVRAIKLLSSDHQSRVYVTQYAQDELGCYVQIASVLVGRGGAATVNEAAITRTPSIIIPVPWVTQNEQYSNAKKLEDLGLCKILPEGLLSPEMLAIEIDKMIDKIKSNQLKVKDKEIDRIYIKDSDIRIANILEKYL